MLLAFDLSPVDAAELGRLRDPAAIMRLLSGKVSLRGLFSSLAGALRPAPPQTGGTRIPVQVLHSSVSTDFPSIRGEPSSTFTTIDSASRASPGQVTCLLIPDNLSRLDQ